MQDIGKAYNELKQGEPAIERLFDLAKFKSKVIYYLITSTSFSQKIYFYYLLIFFFFYLNGHAIRDTSVKL